VGKIAKNEGEDVINNNRKIYQLDNAPPQMSRNEYIVRYKQTGDYIYLRYFLHNFESKLNGIARKVCKKYRVNSRFEDVKQVITETILKRLPDYDLTVGTTLLQYAEPYIKAAINNYIGRYGSATFSLNSNAYRQLRQVNAIYYDSLEQTERGKIAEIIRQTGLDESDIRAIIVGGRDFRYPYSIDYTLEDEDRGKVELVTGDVPDIYSNPDTLIPGFLFYDDLVDAVDKLPYKQQTVLLEEYGIKCLGCGRIGKRMPQQEIANLYELYSTRAVQKQEDKAVEAIIRELTAKGWFRSMTIRQVGKLMQNGELVTALYSYTPAFSDEAGLLEFDLTRPAEKGYIIDRVTPWDRQYPFFRRLVREVAKMQVKGEFVKEKVVAWWKN